MSDFERNKANAIAFYDLMFNQSRPREAIERYVGAEYIQHNPGVTDGKQGFIDYFEEAARCILAESSFQACDSRR
jgi:predicted SnoaL-like aldol condensation-catalyzing enzyme